MRLIFAGTPEFAAVALRGLLQQGHDIALVLTQPDRPAGRGMKLLPSAVKQVAQQSGIALMQPTSLKDADVQSQLAAVQAELMIVVAYGLILPEAVLKISMLLCCRAGAVRHPYSVRFWLVIRKPAFA